jgi:hypothetical protein
MTAHVRGAVRVALPAWVVGRLLALACLGIVALTHSGHTPRAGGVHVPGSHGWWAWDAAWYRLIAERGYLASPPGGVRFFPLFPLLGRGLGAVFGGHDGVALVLLANVFALAFGTVVVLLTEQTLNSAAVARRAAWLTLLAPGAVVLAMAFAEPLSGFLSALFLLLVRNKRRLVWWAAPIGLLVGLTRPTGFLLAAVPAVEYLVANRRRELGSLLAAAAGPIAGTIIFCTWAAHVYGDFLAPYHVQTEGNLRGGLVANPLHAIFTAPNHAGLPIPLRIAVVIATVALIVLAWRVLPPSIALWATLLAVAALTSERLTSLPRYISGDFPLLMAFATRVPARRAVLAVVVSAALFVAVAITGFDGNTVL